MTIKERWYKTVVLSAVLSTFLYSLSIYLPILGGFVSFFSPLPLGYVRLKYSNIESYLSLFLICILLFFIGGKLGVFLFLLQYGLPFLMFIEIFVLFKEPYNSMIISSVAIICLFYLIFFVFTGFSLNKVNYLIQSYIEKSIEIGFKNYSGGLSKAELIEITAKLKKTAEILIKILPAMMFGFFSAVMLGNFYILKRIIQKLQSIELTRFRAPFGVVWCFIISGFVTVLLKHSLIWLLALNLFLICSFLFLIQGLCIIEFWIKKYNVSPFMRLLFLFTIFIFQFIFIFIAILGLFDMWFDYRKLNLKEETNEGNS